MGGVTGELLSRLQELLDSEGVTLADLVKSQSKEVKLEQQRRELERKQEEIRQAQASRDALQENLRVAVNQYVNIGLLDELKVNYITIRRPDIKEQGDHPGELAVSVIAQAAIREKKSKEDGKVVGATPRLDRAGWYNALSSQDKSVVDKHEVAEIERWKQRYPGQDVPKTVKDHANAHAKKWGMGDAVWIPGEEAVLSGVARKSS